MLATDRVKALPLPILRALGAEVGPVEFASPEHRLFMDSQAQEVVLSGWMGAGKSRALCEKAWWLAKRYPGVTVGLFRKVAASLPATTERTFWRDVADLRLVAKRNRSESWAELTNGSRIYFLGLDPDPLTGVPSKVGSLDLGWAGVDEAVELTESDWIVLLGRLRDPRMPWHQLAAATNPGPPKHWLRMRMLGHEPERLLIHVKHNRYLPPDYLAVLASLPDTPQGRRLGRGEWAAAEGVIWTLPDEQIRTDGGPWKRVIAGLDWGFVHAFACEVVGQTGSGRLAVLDEMYEHGRTLGEVIPGLQRLRDKYGIRLFYADPSEPAYLEQCQRAGLPVVSATNDVLPGLNAVSEAIASGMTVAPACAGLLEEIPAYTWQQNRTGLMERPIGIGDDACDALRYAVMGLHEGTTVTQDSYLPPTRPPVVRRGDLVLVGKKYLDRAPVNGHR